MEALGIKARGASATAVDVAGSGFCMPRSTAGSREKPDQVVTGAPSLPPALPSPGASAVSRRYWRFLADSMSAGHRCDPLARLDGCVDDVAPCEDLGGVAGSIQLGSAQPGEMGICPHPPYWCSWLAESSIESPHRWSNHHQSKVEPQRTIDARSPIPRVGCAARRSI